MRKSSVGNGDAEQCEPKPRHTTDCINGLQRLTSSLAWYPGGQRVLATCLPAVPYLDMR